MASKMQTIQLIIHDGTVTRESRPAIAGEKSPLAPPLGKGGLGDLKAIF